MLTTEAQVLAAIPCGNVGIQFKALQVKLGWSRDIVLNSLQTLKADGFVTDVLKRGGRVYWKLKNGT